MAKAEDTPGDFETCRRCNCSACPSYPEGANEGFYCVRGRSDCKIEKKGCNCPACSVWPEKGSSGTYYCVQSSFA